MIPHVEIMLAQILLPAELHCFAVFLSILRHLLSRRLRDSKETLLDIRQPNKLFVLLPEGSYFPYHVEPYG